MCRKRHYWSVPFSERRPQQQSTMMATGAKLIISLLFVGALYTTVEAAITGWTNPASADGAATPSIAEDTVAGTTGVTILATAGGSLSYAIDTQPTAGKLTIAPGGLLSLAAGNSFDFETEPTYVLTVIATDTGDSTSETATVTLSITDANDAPTFASQYAAAVPDASTGGTAVTTVTATDVDASDTRTYSITSGNTNTDFAIVDSATGAITVAAGQTLAAGTLAGYTLEITATDAAGLTGTTEVWVAVTDCTGSGAGVVVASLLSLFVAFTVALY